MLSDDWKTSDKRSEKTIKAVFALTFLLLGGFFWSLKKKQVSQSESSLSSESTTPSGRFSAPSKSDSIRSNQAKAQESSLDKQVASLLREFHSFSETWLDNETTVSSFLASQNRSPDALLAATLETQDPSYIREALEKDPKNPLLLFHATSFEDVPLEQRLQWSETLKEQDPTNALAAAIHATLLSKSGKQEEAFTLLLESSHLNSWQDYSGQTLSAIRGLHEHAGFSPLLSKFTSSLSIPIANEISLGNAIKSIGEHLSTNSPNQTEEFRNLTSQLGQRLLDRGETGSMLHTLIGLNLQHQALENLEEHAPSPFEGLSASEAQQHLKQQSNVLHSHLKTDNPLTPFYEATQGGNAPDPASLPHNLTPKLLEGYVDRSTFAGELNALIWLKQQLRQPSSN